MKTVKTAQGKVLNMGALAAQNEETRAISNVPINARGDIIDNRGKVTIPREDISKEFYKNNVPGSDEKEVGIKEEINTSPKAEPKQDIPTKDEAEIEISRTEREREDGSSYYEVEYMDGSMEEIDILRNPKDKK
jgi:hypothetical protein|tara:strand:- start:3667 stop:4068 length:402 start_codon:yes stop_codon:yes gene_type:complete